MLLAGQHYTLPNRNLHLWYNKNSRVSSLLNACRRNRLDHGQDCVRVGLSAHGFGVFSLRSLAAEDWIGPIEGTVVEELGYGSDYSMEFGDNLALEPDAPFRYLNHSCRPNCVLVECESWRDDGTSDGPQLWLEVQCEIEPHQEMTIDYGWPAEAAIPCKCGDAECRGWIVAAEELKHVAAAESR
ncbi:MAG: SET domain-containing protein-lysine N-methyltransferase [Planctomycetota bacterium]